MNFSLRKLFAITTVIALGIWFFHSAYVDFTHVENGENVPAVDWLPEHASNVSYYHSYMFTAYEFDITEPEFLKWSEWEVAEISEPVKIRRYNLFADVALPGQNSTQAEDAKFMAAMAQKSATIDDGLYYGHLQNNGGGIWVGYDRKLGRAFYQSAPR